MTFYDGRYAEDDDAGHAESSRSRSGGETLEEQQVDQTPAFLKSKSSPSDL